MYDLSIGNMLEMKEQSDGWNPEDDRDVR